MKNLNDLTVVVVTYLTKKDILLNCLKSIDKKVKIIINIDPAFIGFL